MDGITYQNKDITAKIVGDSLKGKSLKIFGLPNRSQMIRALAGILTFSDKVIDRDYAKQVKEVIVMTQVGQMLIDEGMEKGIEKGIAKVIQAMLRKNKSVTEIHEITDISIDIILKVKDSFTDLS